MSILPEELQSFKYYENLTPMYLKDVDGFLDQIQIWFDVFMKKGFESVCSNNNFCGDNIIGRNSNSAVYVIDKIFNCLDIFNKFSNLNSVASSDLLDKLASLFGVKRRFSVIINDVRKQLQLNDKEQLILIKCQIIKNFFEGSYEHLIKCFNLIDLPILPLTKQNSQAHCEMYMLLKSEDEVSENIKDMFLAGLLSIESMGIYYSYAIQIAENIAIFDKLLENASFDIGQFVL